MTIHAVNRESIRQLRQLIALHGANAIIKAATEIAREIIEKDREDRRRHVAAMEGKEGKP